MSITESTAQKMKFSIKDFFSKCDQIRAFTEKIFNGKLHFLCSAVLLFLKIFVSVSLLAFSRSLQITKNLV